LGDLIAFGSTNRCHWCKGTGIRKGTTKQCTTCHGKGYLQATDRCMHVCGCSNKADAGLVFVCIDCFNNDCDIEGDQVKEEIEIEM